MGRDRAHEPITTYEKNCSRKITSTAYNLFLIYEKNIFGALENLKFSTVKITRNQ